MGWGGWRVTEVMGCGVGMGQECGGVGWGDWGWGGVWGRGGV